MRSCPLQSIYVAISILVSACAMDSSEDSEFEQNESWYNLEEDIDEEGGIVNAFSNEERHDNDDSFLAMDSARRPPLPRIIVAFALYGNLKKDWEKYSDYRFAMLPGKLSNRKRHRDKWFAINTLARDYFSIYKYNKRYDEDHKETYWNSPNENLWIYEDTNTSHIASENIQIELAAQNRAVTGYVYMGHGENFRDIESLPVQPYATYFFQVYDNDSFSDYETLGHSSRAVPMFDVSMLANSKGKRRCDPEKHPKWSFSKAKMCYSIMDRYKNNMNEKTILIGLYSGCFIEGSDSAFLRRELDQIQRRLSNSRFDCDGL